MSSSFRRSSAAGRAPPPEMAGPVKAGSLASLGGSTLGGDLTESAHADAQDLTGDSLEIMREIVMRIRTDPEFASSIYADCPRLQHLLDQRPDLRPIFEDPNLVRINFEQVYRDAGGKLPEDEEAEKEARSRLTGFRAILVKIVNHPLFKVLRFLLLIKKIVSCVTGGGVSMIRGLFQQMCCSGAVEAAGVDHPDADGNNGGHPVDGPDASSNAETKAALDKVATHMEDPEVQAQMQDLLQNDPDGLQDAINNDPELSALRDSNPLCAQLMQDPDTMKILVDPDNLRALGDCPDLIEQDFADPNWTPPDVEAGDAANGGNGMDLLDGGGDGEEVIDLDSPDGGAGGGEVVEIDLDGDGNVDANDVDGEADGDDGVDVADSGGGGGGGGGGDNALQDFELGDNSGDNGGGGMAKGAGGGNRSRDPNQPRSGGFISSVGAGFTDLIAQQVVGVGFSDLMPSLGGDAADALGLDGLEGLDDGGAADQAVADSADQATNQFASAVDETDTFLNDSYGNQLDTLERGMDEFEDQADAFATSGGQNGGEAAASQGGQMAGAAAVGVAAAEGAIIGSAFAGVGNTQQRQVGQANRGVADSRSDDTDPIIMVDDGDDDPEATKKKKYGWFGNLGSAMVTAAKESIAGAVLGNDLGELLVEKQEERREEREKEKNASKRSLNVSRSDLMNGSQSDLNGSVGDMNRSKNSLSGSAALGPASPSGKKPSLR